MRNFFSNKRFRKIKAHDCHPREHGDGGDVAKITDKLAEIFIIELEIKDCEEEACNTEYTDNIAQDNLAMEVIEIRDDPVDKENNAQRHKTHNSEDSENENNIIHGNPFPRLFAEGHHKSCTLRVITRSYVPKTYLRIFQILCTVVDQL